MGLKRRIEQLEERTAVEQPTDGGITADAARKILVAAIMAGIRLPDEVPDGIVPIDGSEIGAMIDRALSNARARRELRANW